MTDSQNGERWISRRAAAQILGLNPVRVGRYLAHTSVRKREVPLGENRRAFQFWLADVLELQRGALAQ